jgi:hypothetical protein
MAAATRITVVRAFLLRGARQEPGAEVEVEPALARELVALGKAAVVAGSAPAAPGPLTTDTAPALAGGRRRSKE